MKYILTEVAILENLRGLLIPSWLTSAVVNVNVSFEISLLTIGAVKHDSPTVLRQNSKMLSHIGLIISQAPPLVP